MNLMSLVAVSVCCGVGCWTIPCQFTVNWKLWTVAPPSGIHPLEKEPTDKQPQRKVPRFEIRRDAQEVV